MYRKSVALSDDPNINVVRKQRQRRELVERGHVRTRRTKFVRRERGMARMNVRRESAQGFVRESLRGQDPNGAIAIRLDVACREIRSSSKAFGPIEKARRKSVVLHQEQFLPTIPQIRRKVRTTANSKVMADAILGLLKIPVDVWFA